MHLLVLSCTLVFCLLLWRLTSVSARGNGSLAGYLGHGKMSVAKNEEVRTHQLGLRLGEPVAGVPIKKRPVQLSDRSLPSGIPLSMMPSSNSTGISASAVAVGCSNEPFLNRSKSDIPNRSVTPSTAEKQGVLLNGSSESPSRGASVAPILKSQSQKFLTLDLQLASRHNVKINSSSPVKKEKLDQGFSILPSARPSKDDQTTSGVGSPSNSSLGKLSNLDLNVSLDPVGQPEALPTMHTGRTFQHQEAQVPLVAPFSTMNSRLSLNIDNTMNLSNAYEPSNKGEAADVTLDLQLKPPTRPELGISWKGLAPDPELSLSLSGNHTDEPKGLNGPEAIFTSEPVGMEIATPGSDKSPAKKILEPVPCTANPRTTMPSPVSGNMEIMSASLVKKEPEESSRRHIQNIEKPSLFDLQSVGQVSNCADFGKTGNANLACDKAGIDLKCGNFSNNSIRNGLEVVTASVPVQTDKFSDVACTENMPANSDVGKFIKHEEVTTDIPSPVIATISGQPVSSIAKSFLSEGSHPVKSSTDCNPTSSPHARENVTRKHCDVSRSSSNPSAGPLIFNSVFRPVLDGMSQGSASMDCSDDVDNAVSQLPTTSKPRAGSLFNSRITEATNLSTELRKEDSDMHLGEEHGSGVSVNGKYKGKQLLTSKKNFPLNSTDVAMQDVNIAMCAIATDLRKSPAMGTSGSPKIDSTGPSHKKFDSTIEKSRMPVIKSERSQSPDGKQAVNCSDDNGKIAAVKREHGTENEDVSRASNLQPSDSVLGEEDSHLDGASTSQPHNESTKVKPACEGSEDEKSKLDSCMTSVQNEKDGQVNGSHWRDVANAYVNRNERWERFMESEKNREYRGGRHSYDMNNQRRMDHRYGGRGRGYHGPPKNFRGPRMSDDSEIDFADGPITGRRRAFENDFGHMHRMPHRRLRSPPNQMPGCIMRGMDHDPRLQMEDDDDVPDEMMEDRFFVPHPRQQHAPGDHAFIHRDRSHSPGQRRGAPMHFHRGRSPETMHRSPPLNKTDRSYLPHQRHMRRRGSPPFDRVGHDERGGGGGGGMQRNMRRCGMHQGAEGENFEPPLHPAQLAKLHAASELTERRKFAERRAYPRSLEGSPADDEEMLSYHEDGDMEFADGDGGGPREADGRFRNRMEHRARGEQDDGYKYRGPPQGCRGGNSNNDSRSKKRRY